MEKSKLIKVAKQLNYQFGLKPKIDLKLSDNALKEKIMEGWGLRKNDDTFSEDILEVINELLKERNG